MSKKAKKQPAVTRGEVAEAFRRARAVLWDGKSANSRGKEVAICYALSASETSLTERAIKVARGVVMHRLHPCSHLTVWLGRSGHATWFELESPSAQEKLQATRRAWLDSLIAEFSERPGDPA